MSYIAKQAVAGYLADFFELDPKKTVESVKSVQLGTHRDGRRLLRGTCEMGGRTFEIDVPLPNPAKG